MAMGVPVVTSAIAAGGVDAESVTHFLVANTPQEYADAVLSIIENPGERARLAHSGRQRMLSHHAWTKSMERLDKMVFRAIENFKKKRETSNAN